MSVGLDLSGYNDPKDLEGFDRVKVGNYHALIMEVDDSRAEVNGLKVKFAVMNGSDPTQVQKNHSETFFDPRPDQEEWQQKRAIKMQAKLALATGIITTADLGKPNVMPNWQAMRGRQVCISLKERIAKKGTPEEKTYVNIDQDKVAIYSPWEQDAVAIPKHDNMLAQCPKLPGLTAACYLQQSQSGGNGQAAGQAVGQVAQGQQVAQTPIQQPMNPANQQVFTTPVAAQPAQQGAAGNQWAGI